MKKYIVIGAGVVLVLNLFSCEYDKVSPDGNLPAYHPTPMEIVIPSNLPLMNIPENNPTTVEGVYLGRRLYYDSLLHPKHERACGGCHHQGSGFTTQGTTVIPHINLGFSHSFLWNGAVEGTLEDAMLFEVEEFFNTDVSRLQRSDVYPMLFYKAFGSTNITTQRCAFALAQFLRTLVSGNSKFDKFARHEENLSVEETNGLIIFYTEKGDCFHCHSLSVMTDGNRHNIGLDSIFTGVNSGYYNVTGNPADYGKFKSPSLRNCTIRSSFMHDGRFTTLDQVIDHYNNGVKRSPSLDPIMTKPSKATGLHLSPYDIQCLKSFLSTLTDSTYLTNPDFANPF